MKTKGKQHKAPSPSPLEALAEFALTASPEEFRQWEERIFNDARQDPNLSLMWLDGARRMRAGVQPREAIGQHLVSQPGLPYRASCQPPRPWTDKSADGQDAEYYLRKLGIAEVLWADLWSKVEYIARLQKDPPAGNTFLALPAIVPAADRTASKQARYFKRHAARMRKAGDEVRADNSERYASYLAQTARESKRHSTEPHTLALLSLQLDIHAATKRWHDTELAGLLRCAGHPENLATEGVLRTLRAKNAERMKWL